jgi:hypothetical protein
LTIANTINRPREGWKKRSPNEKKKETIGDTAGIEREKRKRSSTAMN